MAQTLSIPAHGFGPRPRQSQVGPLAGAASPTEEPGSLGLLLLIAFIVQLFSNAALLFPVLSAVRPAQTIGGLALLVLICQVATGRKLELAAPDGYLLMAFVAAAALSIFGAVWPAYAFDACIDLIKIAVIYVLIVNTIVTERRLRVLLWTLVLCGLFPALGSLWNWYRQIRVEGRAAWLGFFANPNEMAYSLVVLVPLAWALARRSRWSGRLLLSLLVGLLSVAIYLSFSRGSVIGLAVVCAYIGLRQRSGLARALVLGLLLAGALVGPIYWSRDAGFHDIQADADFNERLTTYQVAWSMYSQSPVLGVGLNCSAVAWPLYAPSERLTHHKWLITHNTFIQALSETGTLGGGLLLTFFAVVVRKAWRVSRSEVVSERVRELAAGLEVAFWGFLVCGMSGGYVMSWFPYLLAGLVGALPMVSESARAAGEA
jgi:O-antigen ligase